MRSRVALKMFVSVFSGELAGLGIARLISKRAGMAIIEFFAGPEQDVQPRYEVPLSSVRQTAISRETRIFSPVQGGAFWRVGRCLDGADDLIQVQFPNQETVSLPSSEVFVRWRRPIASPERYLARFITETPMFAHARSRFVRSVVSQRATALGITAALSSAIELEPHQLEVARRVLHDPIQRYLLADEVGLGKTIEACIIVRQYFIDHPYDASALVLVPPALVKQWQQELRSRFSLHDELGTSLHVVSTEALEEVEAMLPDVGLLVVDEAHHLTADSAQFETLYDTICNKGSAIPRLLLLSATPVLGNERAFHKMLHLLDPTTYPLDGIVAFQHRISGRQHIAEAVAALIPENALVLEPYVEELLVRFDSDEMLQSAVDTLRKILARYPDPDDAELTSALVHLRTHIADTYRLDRRILRNRRSHLPFLTPVRRGSKVWSYLDSSRAALAAAIDQVRRSLDAIVGTADQESSLREQALTLMACSLDGPRALLDWTASRSEDLQSGLQADLAALAALAVEASAGAAREECLYQNIRRLIDRGVKAIVFCSSAVVADGLYQYLRGRMPANVERHGRQPRRGEPGWERFLQKGSCEVLVCDPSGEEGLNLQGGAKTLVHYDLPLAPNRIEQRIGRLDRYGSGDAIESFALVCDDDPMESEWYRCLANGFGVFSRSIASLQFLVDDVMKQLKGILVEQGAHGFDQMTETLGGPTGKVNAEFKRIAAQDALDALSSEGDVSWEAMSQVDTDWKTIRDAFDPWIHQTLSFGKEDVPTGGHSTAGDRTNRYRFANDARHPTLVSATEFALRFASAMDRTAPDFKPLRPVTYPYTFRRKSALSAGARLQHIRVLRAGDSFVDGLEEFTRHDDRGRVYAFWRYARDYVSASTINVDVYFHVHVIIQADVQPAIAAMEGSTNDQLLYSAPLQRRADALFAPLSYSVWVDSNFQSVDAAFVEQWLDPDYNKSDNGVGGRDTNLRTDRWDEVRARGVPEMDAWNELPGRAATAALKLSMHNESTQHIIRRANEAARSAWAKRAAQLQLRIKKLVDIARRNEEIAANRERGVTLALIRGVNAPLASVDSIGAVFLSPSVFEILPNEH
jgi:ATP-dependent helicase HepA